MHLFPAYFNVFAYNACFFAFDLFIVAIYLMHFVSILCSWVIDSLLNSIIIFITYRAFSIGIHNFTHGL